MTNRLIDAGIWQNEKFSSLEPLARLLSIGLVSHADDQGRGKAHPVYIRSQLLPYDDVPASIVGEWLEQIAANGTILLYEVGGKAYYQLVNWWQYQAHQYAMPSKFPKPEGWRDRIRKTLRPGVIVTCNWLAKDGRQVPDTCDETGSPIHHLMDQVNHQVMDQLTYQEEDKDKDKEEDSEIAAAPQPGADAPSPVVEKGKRKTAKEKAPVPEPVTWFRSVVGRFPPKELFAAVVDVVETRRDEAFLKRCQTEWIARGYNPSNYAWLLDWYGAGIIPATRGGTGRVVATNGANSHAAYPNGSAPSGADLERRIEAARAKFAQVSSDVA